MLQKSLMQRIQTTFTFTAMACLLAAPRAGFICCAHAQPVKASRELAATVIVSPDGDWVEKWNTPQAPRITRLRTVEVDQKVTVGILVSGLRPVKGRVRYSVAVQIIDPKGKVIFDPPDFASRASGKAPSGNAFLLVNPTFDFSAEKSDPRGVYRFRAVVTDLNRAKNTKFKASGEWKVELK